MFVVGTDFFPSVDAGIMKLHFRAPSGTRIESTEKLVARRRGATSARIVPTGELETVNDMIGVPINYNLAFVQTDNIGPMDADILIALKPHHRPTRDYMKQIRTPLARNFPGLQHLLPAGRHRDAGAQLRARRPIDVQIEGPTSAGRSPSRASCASRSRTVPGTADVHITQVLDYPDAQVDVDRAARRAARACRSATLPSADAGLAVVVVVGGAVVLPEPEEQRELHGGGQDAAAEGALGADPVVGAADATVGVDAAAAGRLAVAAELPESPTQTLGNVSSLSTRACAPTRSTHYTVQRVLDIGADVEGRDLGSVRARHPGARSTRSRQLPQAA